MEIIDEDTIDRLFSIKDQMHKYYYNDRKIIASKENLINFLNNKILLPAINDERETR
jgi:tagatose-1,6-bisphosphate aldolase non-catalytic subunit AgaZ/GatZ